MLPRDPLKCHPNPAAARPRPSQGSRCPPQPCSVWALLTHCLTLLPCHSAPAILANLSVLATQALCQLRVFYQLSHQRGFSARPPGVASDLLPLLIPLTAFATSGMALPICLSPCSRLVCPIRLRVPQGPRSGRSCSVLSPLCRVWHTVGAQSMLLNNLLFPKCVLLILSGGRGCRNAPLCPAHRFPR